MIKEIRTPENKSFEQVIYRGIDEALAELHTNFEENPNRFGNLPYHNSIHTKRVMRRTGLILRAAQSVDPLLVSARDLKLGQFVAAYHDVVQDWEEERKETSGLVIVKRKRHVVDNENASAVRAITFMDKVNSETHSDVFTQEDKDIILEAIRVTIPGFDPALGTVKQPLLTEQSSIIARAIALADIGTAGLDESEVMVEEGNSLFREENLDILEAIEGGYNIPEDYIELFRKRMLEWTAFQVIFAQGRQKLLAKELQGIPASAKVNVEKLFNRFGDSILALRLQIEKRKQLPFDKLLEEFGYKVPSN